MKKYIFILLFSALGSLLLHSASAQKQADSAAITMPGEQVGAAWGFAYGYDRKPEVFMPQLRKLGIRFTKLYLFWHQLEPTKGQYDWRAVDTFITQLRPGDEALISVFSSSLWATKVASSILPPSQAKDSADYYKLISLLVKRCKGKIRYWQNDCEPNNPVYWGGTVDEFISQLKVFYHAVKSAQPGAQVVIGGYDGLFNPPGMWKFPGQDASIAFFLKAIKEAADYFDVFDLRLYADPYTIPGRVQYFRQQLAAYGHHQPIICTEYNGPSFFNFPVNLKYAGQVAAWTQAVVTHDSAAFRTGSKKSPVELMYDSLNTLAPQTQMFMQTCTKELNDKYDRMQCRDLVYRNMLAFAAGVQKTLYWDVWHDNSDRYNLMTLMFGKNKLLEYTGDKLSVESPTAEALRLMAKMLGHITKVERLEQADKPLLFLYRVSRAGRGPVYVIWEKRDAFSGEGQPATHYVIAWHATKAAATDIFGATVTMGISAPGQLGIDITDTPVFIEGEK